MLVVKRSNFVFARILEVVYCIIAFIHNESSYNKIKCMCSYHTYYILYGIIVNFYITNCLNLNIVWNRYNYTRKPCGANKRKKSIPLSTLFKHETNFVLGVVYFVCTRKLSSCIFIVFFSNWNLSRHTYLPTHVYSAELCGKNGKILNWEYILK